MGIISLLTKDIKKVQIKSIVLDASIQEDHNYTAEVTESPLESGYSITDHVIIKPLRLTISGIVSSTPLANLGVGTFGEGFTNPSDITSHGSLLRKATPLIGVGIGNGIGYMTYLVRGSPDKIQTRKQMRMQRRLLKEVDRKNIIIVSNIYP